VRLTNQEFDQWNTSGFSYEMRNYFERQLIISISFRSMSKAIEKEAVPSKMAAKKTPEVVYARCMNGKYDESGFAKSPVTPADSSDLGPALSFEKSPESPSESVTPKSSSEAPVNLRILVTGVAIECLPRTEWVELPAKPPTIADRAVLLFYPDLIRFFDTVWCLERCFF